MGIILGTGGARHTTRRYGRVTEGLKGRPMRIEDDRGLSDLLLGEEVRLCGGFGFTEGPVWVRSDHALLFSDIPGNRTHRWRPGSSEAEVYREPSGNGNGLTLDAAGNVIWCEHSGRRIARAPYRDASRVASVVERWEGKRLNSPNDLIVHSSGAIFFTDPTFGLGGAPGEIGFTGVYRIDPDGALHAVVREGLSAPNGLVLTLDESALYVCDSSTKQIWRYAVHADLGLGERTLFADQSADARPGVPDGMKLDTAGRLWTTGAGGVSVYTASGERLGVFEIDEHAANLAFGGDDLSTLYLTARTSIYAVRTTATGIGVGPAI